jgi:hypothetical protein
LNPTGTVLALLPAVGTEEEAVMRIPGKVGAAVLAAAGAMALGGCACGPDYGGSYSCYEEEEEEDSGGWFGGFLVSLVFGDDDDDDDCDRSSRHHDRPGKMISGVSRRIGKR